MHVFPQDVKRGRRAFILEVSFPGIIYLIALAKALREIRYYQSAAMAEAHLIPSRAFERLVKEIGEEARTDNPLRWEKDAIFSLQEITEHVLVMVFEMTYYISVIPLILRNKLAIHAKRQTIMPHDMSLLRDLWQRIAPESAIGADDAEMVRQKQVRRIQEVKRFAKAKKTASITMAQAKVNGTVDRLPMGLKHFYTAYNIS